jgi:23S rRNA-/tRNA-specific pseudouridylate synthase
MNEDQTDTPVAVAAAGQGWIVVDKPAGVSVHNDPGRDLCARVQTLLTEDPQVAQATGFAAGRDPHAPHRLDRDTSGLVLLCCQESALQHFGAAFRDRRVGKCYLAVLHGHLEGPGGVGLWSYPLARSGGGRRNPSGQGRRAVCRTAFQVLGHSDHYTLAACAPLTGRRHQIRRHAKLAGHPVVGDRRYGSPRSLRFLRETAGFDRLALHAWGLDLPLPSRGARQVVLSRTPPRIFFQLLAADGDTAMTAWEDVLRELADPIRWPGRGAL